MIRFPKFRKLVAFVPAIVVVAIVATAALESRAQDTAPKPAAKPGLYWDMRTQGIADVRRFKDTSNGVVCYVAKNIDGEDSSYGGDNKSPSISCVKP